MGFAQRMWTWLADFIPYDENYKEKLKNRGMLFRWSISHWFTIIL